MKTITKQTWLVGMTSLLFALSLMSFAWIRGGYGYTIHINNKLAGEYYLTDKHETPSHTLSVQDLRGSLTVYFNECGEIGQGRKLVLRDANQKLLKEWRFANSIKQHEPMEIALQEIFNFQTSGKTSLYYSSTRVITPQLLTYMVMPANSKITSR